MRQLESGGPIHPSDAERAGVMLISPPPSSARSPTRTLVPRSSIVCAAEFQRVPGEGQTTPRTPSEVTRVRQPSVIASSPWSSAPSLASSASKSGSEMSAGGGDGDPTRVLENGAGAPHAAINSGSASDKPTAPRIFVLSRDEKQTGEWIEEPLHGHVVRVEAASFRGPVA